MNARPTKRFLFRLAGHLGMTIRELGQRMDSRELSEWMAYERYYHGTIGDEWRQIGMLASAILAPYCKRGSTPKPEDFVPIDSHVPQHWTQIREAVRQMQKDLGGES